MLLAMILLINLFVLRVIDNAICCSDGDLYRYFEFIILSDFSSNSLLKKNPKKIVRSLPSLQ
jgi:hypothetical protein